MTMTTHPHHITEADVEADAAWQRVKAEAELARYVGLTDTVHFSGVDIPRRVDRAVQAWLDAEVARLRMIHHDPSPEP